MPPQGMRDLVKMAIPKMKSPASKERLYKLFRVKYLLQILKGRRNFQTRATQGKATFSFQRINGHRGRTNSKKNRRETTENR